MASLLTKQIDRLESALADLIKPAHMHFLHFMTYDCKLEQSKSGGSAEACLAKDIAAGKCSPDTKIEDCIIMNTHFLNQPLIGTNGEHIRDGSGKIQCCICTWQQGDWCCHG